MVATFLGQRVDGTIASLVVVLWTSRYETPWNAHSCIEHRLIGSTPALYESSANLMHIIQQAHHHCILDNRLTASSTQEVVTLEALHTRCCRPFSGAADEMRSHFTESKNANKCASLLPDACAAAVADGLALG